MYGWIISVRKEIVLIFYLIVNNIIVKQLIFVKLQIVMILIMHLNINVNKFYLSFNVLLMGLNVWIEVIVKVSLFRKLVHSQLTLRNVFGLIIHVLLDNALQHLIICILKLNVNNIFQTIIALLNYSEDVYRKAVVQQPVYKKHVLQI